MVSLSCLQGERDKARKGGVRPKQPSWLWEQHVEKGRSGQKVGQCINFAKVGEDGEKGARGKAWRGDGPCEFSEYCCLACNPADLEVGLLLAPFLQM